MPASVVKSADQPKAVREILSGIDLPPAFTAADVSSMKGLTTDRYQLGALTVSSVACTWLGRWRPGDSKATGRRFGIPCPNPSPGAAEPVSFPYVHYLSLGGSPADRLGSEDL